MASRGTLHRFAAELDDRVRAARRSVDLRVQRHPSEGAERFVARLLALVLVEPPPGAPLELSAGVCAGDEPPISATDGQGLALWVELGVPDAERLRRACRRARAVVVVSFRPRERERLELPDGRLASRVSELPLDPALVRELAARLERTVAWRVVRGPDALEVEVGGARLRGTSG